MVKCLSQQPGLAGCTELCPVKHFLSHFSQISSCDESKHIISRPAMLYVQCRSAVLKCFKHVKSFSLMFRASLISLDAFIQPLFLSQCLILSFCLILTEKFIIPALSIKGRTAVKDICGSVPDAFVGL